MSKLKIALLEISDWEQEYMQSELSDFLPIFFPAELKQYQIEQIKDCDILSVFIYSQLKRDMLEQLPNLKLIATRSTGFDHIDLEYCKEKNIIVSNVPTYGENTVAEHTFALILSLSRNIHKAYMRTKNMNFSVEGLMGFDLKGKTLGVVGAGHIGFHVIKMALGFGMNVLVYDVKKNNFIRNFLQFDYIGLDELLSRSDIVTLHAPYNLHTHHLINKNNIKLMKEGSLLINTARGGLIDTAALIWALDNKIISGAGLDVLEDENLVREDNPSLAKNYPIETMNTLLNNRLLLQRDNVVITPHNAFNSREALTRILETTVINIKSYCSGKPENQVQKL